MMFRILLLTLLSSIPAFAQEAASGVAVEEPTQNYETTVRSASFQSTSKIVIDEETIKKSKAANIGNLLSTQANITIASTNQQPNTIFLRGGDSSHLLILVDGVPFFDAGTTQRTTNLNNIDLKSIRRIEILKGPQSVLYGGQALTGVIKIETFPLELKDKAHAAIEAGRFNYNKASAAGLISNEDKDLAAFLRGYWSQKMNPSPVKDSSEVYPNYLNGGDLALISRGELTSFVKFSQSNESSQLQDTGMNFEPVDATDFKFKNKVSSVTAGLSLPQSILRPRLLVGHQDGVRTYELAPSTWRHYGSNLTHVRFETDLVSDNEKSLLFGLSYQKERFLYRETLANLEKFDSFNEQKGAFAKWTQDFGSLLGYEIGLRSDFINHQDRADSIQLGLILLEKVKLEYATGYKTASLYQLYGDYGNSDLKPERARTYSLTYENNMDSQSFSFTLFDTHFDGLITTTGTYPMLQYNNISRAQTKGVEASYSIVSDDQLKGFFNFGYQEPRDVDSGKWLARRPLVTASTGVSKDWEKTTLGMELVHTGSRVDRPAGAAEKTLASRTVLNLNANYQLESNLSVYGRANNVTDQKFEQTKGYYDEGFFGFVGLEFQN